MPVGERDTHGAGREGAAKPCDCGLPTPEACAAVRRDSFWLTSSDDATALGCDVWLPAGGSSGVVATVQLVHGMTEHIGRYDTFARVLAARGCAVVGHDHLAHGCSVISPENWGVLPAGRGADYLVADVQLVRLRVEGRFPDVPHVIFGHSMGSFVTRAFLGKHGSGLAGALIFGTGWQPSAALAFGRAATSALAALRGWDFRSKLIDGLAVGAYARRFAREEGGKLAWLSRDAAARDAYAADPACGFTFSLGAYHELFRLIGMAQDRALVQGMPHDLPVLLASGTQDPVGGMGKAVPRVASLLSSCGVTDVEQRLYPGARHELLNETNRAEVMTDVVDWLERKGIVR